MKTVLPALDGKGWTEGRTEAETMNSSAHGPRLEHWNTLPVSHDITHVQIIHEIHYINVTETISLGLTPLNKHFVP